MIERLLLVGAGGFGRVVLEHAEKEYDCAFLDDGQEEGTLVDEVTVIGKTSDLEKFYLEYKRLLVAIGNNKLRQAIYEKAEVIGYTFPNILVPSSYVSSHANIADGVILLNNAVVQNGAKVGRGTILNPGVEAHQDVVIGNFCLIYANSVIRSLAHIGNRVLIGSTVTISTGEVIPDDAVVDDGAVVKSDLTGKLR